jgi:hypothetical protein
MNEEKVRRFIEPMLEQPPAETVGWVDKGDRLWLALDRKGDRLHSIYCPYRVGNKLPEEVVGIRAIIKSERRPDVAEHHWWCWEVEVQGSPRSKLSRS